MLNQTNFKKRIIEKKWLHSGEKILVGFSGGSDSAALSHILAELREELGFSLELLYIQHHLRGEESRSEEIFVEKWAERYHLPLRIGSVDVQKYMQERKLSVETAARHLRRQLMQQIQREEGFTKIALAHHAKDQAETVLMHFFRGSGVGGLAGMRVLDGAYFRPLLEYSKEEIMDYICKEQIAWCEDSTNQDRMYRRNRVRLEIIPYLQKHFNADIVGGMGCLARQMQDLEDYLQPQIEEAFQKANMRRRETVADKEKTQGDSAAGSVFLSVDVLSDMPTYLQQMVIRRAFYESKGNTVNLEYSHIQRAISLLYKESGKKEDLVDGWRIRKSYNYLIIERGRTREPKALIDEPNQAHPFFVLGLDRIKRNRYIKVIKDYILIARISKDGKETDRKCRWKQQLDYDCLPKELIFRMPDAKDYIRINANGNRKKLKDYFADSKVAKEHRAKIPVLAVGNEVIWVAGHRVGYPYRVTAQTENYLKLVVLGRTGKCRKLKRESQKQK